MFSLISGMRDIIQGSTQSYVVPWLPGRYVCKAIQTTCFSFSQKESDEDLKAGCKI